MMHHLVSKVLRRAFSSVEALCRNASCSDMVTNRNLYTISALHRKFENTKTIAIPSDFSNWGSLGFSRMMSLQLGSHPCSQSLWSQFLILTGLRINPRKNLLTFGMIRYFVIPLWKGSGYTTMFVQVQMPHMLFTGLEDYKARGTQAAPYFTATYYKEFADSKDMVLIRGDVVFTSKLSDAEAKWLLETAQSFYLNDVRYKLVERFNKQTREFEFKDVLRALEMPVL
ncbi:UNVERIFIED_CONTAM: hypothetical protein Scaly_1298200 [Sesamum calycinum]|uniref:ATP synthase mitochondrial F1 complex assembly factor 1 n=1 Tax=Sesamum calycinum TaxID=2727403 RepID=A0AAW2Q7E7_9LAMI